MDNTRIKRKIKNIESLTVKILIFYSIIGVLGFVVPFGFILKAGKRLHGNFNKTLANQIGVFNYFLVIGVIVLVIIAFILIDNKYFALKKDLLDTKRIKFIGTIKKIKCLNNDLGGLTYKVWFKENKKIIISAGLSKSEVLSVGQKVELILTSNANFPIELKILKNTLTKEKIDDMVELLEQAKRK